MLEVVGVLDAHKVVFDLLDVDYVDVDAIQTLRRKVEKLTAKNPSLE